MAHESYNKLNVYLEVGNRRMFAAAVDWPGWCRAGVDEASALQALVDYGPRYAEVARPTKLGFQTPENVSVFEVVERLKGNAATDFGAPNIHPESDAQPLDDAELKRLQTILKACWKKLDATVEKATGKPLRIGPRGGGRSLDKIVEHVLGAERSGYLSALGGKAPSLATLESVRQIILDTLEASAHGKVAERGPRGGRRWSPRYFVRRDAWHILDHVWEVEDRLE